jgi:hypothetical protein
VKKCPSCNKLSPLSQFYKDKSTSTGFQAYCKPCRRKRARAYYKKHAAEISHRIALNPNRKEIQRRTYRKNRVKILRHHKKYQKDHRQKYAEYARRWRQRNPLSAQKAGREWRLRNPEKDAARHKRWNQKNREKIRIRNCFRRSIIRANGGERISVETWKEITSRFGNKCFYCHKRKRLTMDHIQPISKGGPHRQDNLVPACFKCNLLKSNKDFWDFLWETNYGIR